MPTNSWCLFLNLPWLVPALPGTLITFFFGNPRREPEESLPLSGPHPLFNLQAALLLLLL